MANPIHVIECLTHSDIGGGQSVVYEIAARWKSNYPHERMSIILPAEGVYVGRFRELGIDVYEIPFDKLSVVTFIRTFMILRSLCPTIIHSHGKGAGLYTRLIPRWYISAKRIHTYHGFHLPQNKLVGLLYKRFESFLLHFTDIVIAVSKSEADEIRSTYPKHQMKCDVIENVVDCAAIQHSCDALLPLELCQYLEKQSQNTIITMIARYDPVKNYPLALEAASKVLEKKEQCAFIFVGIDPNCIEFKKLKQSFPERIFGVQYLPKPSAIIVRSTITMLTSKKEGGLPLVIQEAFCLGKTVVATEVAGTRELVEHGVNGLLCDESAQSIADAIITIAQDKALLSKLSRGARLTAEKRDVKSWSQRYFDLYYRHASFGACQ